MQIAKLKSSLQNNLSTNFCKIKQHWRDILIALILALLAGLLTYKGSQLVNSAIITDYQAQDLWLGGDCLRVFNDMVSPEANHYRTKVHPLFVLITIPPVSALRFALGIKAITAVRLISAFVAFLWMGTLFILLRLISCRRLDATLLSILGGTSAAAVFWFIVPETYSFGSLSILLGLCLVAIAQHKQVSRFWYIIVSAITLSITVTNWMVGILATAVNHYWKRTLQITAQAFCVVLSLSIVQKLIFPTAKFLFMTREEGRYIRVPQLGNLLTYVKSFVFHSMIMPAFYILPHSSGRHWPTLAIQRSLPGSASIWGYIAVWLWVVLLGLGLWALIYIKKYLKFRIVLGLTILGQLALHAIYGSGETFLFSLHFAPLLVVLVSLSTLTRARPVTLLLTGMLILCAAINNALQLITITNLLNT